MQVYQLALGLELLDMIRFVLGAHFRLLSPPAIAFGLVLHLMQFGGQCVFFYPGWEFMLVLSLGDRFPG